MTSFQELLHKVEVAGGLRYVRGILTVLVCALVMFAYNVRVSKNFNTQEAMDSAQLARNIAEGRGYTTQFVRPFSMHLVAQKTERSSSASAVGTLPDYSRIRAAHPDISNPPVYPFVLAGMMKILPFDFAVSSTKAFWSNNGQAWRYQPDFLIEWFNQLLFLGLIAFTYFWARRVLDVSVARTSAVLLFGSEVLWRFNSSGLSTILLMLCFMGIAWCLTLVEEDAGEPKRGLGGLCILSAVAGLLAGIGGLTRYSFGWMILPTLLFVILFSGRRRILLSAILLGAFLVVMVPWVIRNYSVSGTPFGTPMYGIIEGASIFPGDRLERSLHPDIHLVFRAFWMKFLINARVIFQKELFTVEGGLATALFLAGLLIDFRNSTLRRMRYFLLWSAGVLFVVQAMGRTQLSEDSEMVNSENYLVLIMPLVVAYGVTTFYLLLEQAHLATHRMRQFSVLLFCGVACLPLALSLMPPKGVPVAFPPYLPQAIQQASRWMRPDELMMSDVPWAVAWYGNRQCVWLTLNAVHDKSDPDESNNFFSINDSQKPINALYLSPKTMDLHLQSDWSHAGTLSWGNLIMGVLLNKEHQVPPPFPLKAMAPPSMFPEQLFLTDWKRWQTVD